MAPSLPAPSPCARHPDAAAGWRCEHCEALLCPACVETRRTGTVEYTVCVRCEGTANVLLRHRSQRALWTRVPDALRFPFTVPGLQTLLAVSLMLAVLRSLGMGVRILVVLPMALGLGVFWSAFFALVRGAARGDADPEGPGFTSIVQDNIVPGLRGLGVTVGVFAPALARAWHLLPSVSGYETVGRIMLPLQALGQPVVWADPFFWGLAGLGLLWLPWALLLAATSQSVFTALNPLRTLGCLRAVGPDAGLMTGVFVLLACAHAVMHWGAAWAFYLPVPFVSTWLAEALTCLAPFAAASLLGLVLYVHGDALGYLPARDLLEPALGDTAPQRVPVSLLESPVLEAPGPADAGVEAKVAELGAAVAARDVTKALALYGALHVLPRLKLLPSHHLFIGQAAAVEGDFPLSVKALEAAADTAPDEPTAPRALVLLARVQGEKLGNTVRAEEIYRYIVHRYPDTEAARFSHARLPPAA
ncbi:MULTISPECIES: tetratricopeptide repeat protein [Corallococcus]|uniref:tetratricopeptide repeat protein n=1 Tax=Corallococcus TaxID=83461 RepID=UPI0011C3F73D|nr:MULTISPECIES: tetratricopeptide repeat protein [Corallococcus]NPC70075.1 tetratricopeptide repeat protein [Corallococcus exiguus]NPD22686.1 tetratricopeptide repeat protein [Corallococcus exiguus]